MLRSHVEEERVISMTTEMPVHEATTMPVGEAVAVAIGVREVSYGSKDYEATVELRREILRKPLGLEFSSAELQLDLSDYHFAAFQNSDNEIGKATIGISNEHLIGCLILRPQSRDELKMRQVAVASSVQGRGVGQMLVARSELWAREHGYQEIVLNARETAVKFYLKLGYEIVGDRFSEVDLPHFKMRKALRA